MLESDRLVCENKHNLSLNAIWDPSIYVYFNYKVNLLIGREKIFATVCFGRKPYATISHMTYDVIITSKVYKYGIVF